ncbi:SatD family protein [Fulvivirga ligni]|uniref:SatD family protein n=1 Tax=Fulvivirga ligni TaxID=2904246 RepID=UPI001F1F5AF2|nr:SatD family protein [Fulvivirga ligni]UII19065.1 SatD family protein [Fulvivirga ligni]
MADIIDSSDKNGESLMKHFKNMVSTINQEMKESIVSPLTITLGDEFQGIVDSMESAAKVIFQMDEMLLLAETSYRLRFVVNYGIIDTAIATDRAYEMLGDGLTSARRALNNLKSAESDILVEGVDQKDNLNMAFRLYRALYNDWNEKDKPIAKSFLENNDYKEVADIFDKDISTMWRRQKSLKIDEYIIARNLIYNLSS